VHKFFVLCLSNKHSPIRTHLPVIARDQKHAVKIAQGAGLVPYGVIPGKRLS